jgi:signal transduction histidine kinase
MEKNRSSLKTETPAFAPSYTPRGRVGARTALILGFGALLALMVVLAVDSVGALRDLETSTMQVRRDYLNRERALREIRAGIYESGNLLREYGLATPEENSRAQYVEQLRGMKEHTDRALESFLQRSPANLKEQMERLANELQTYWLAADETLSKGTLKNNEARLQQEALAQRRAVLAISGEVSELNELEFRQAEVDVSRVFAGSREKLRGFAALTIGVGALLAICSILYIFQLEQQAEEKYLESERYRQELKELSKRLVDAQENERRAISRELHDEIAQTLAALLMNIQSLMDNPRNAEPVSQGLQEIRAQAEECVKTVRNMALLLRPSMLDDLGLVAALEWQGREVSKRNGLMVEVVSEHFVDDLPDAYKTCIYRVVQEALHNCTMHAQARHVRVFLQEDSRHCVLSITDDGVGFDPKRQRGMGLLGMQERVMRLDGALAIDSEPGKGTTIRVELPPAVPQRNENYVA